MSDTPVADHRAVRFWLLSMAALIALMVLVGAAMRRTESGLVDRGMEAGHRSPSASQRRRSGTQAFDRYKPIPQYRDTHAGMDLAQFKTIFWWEWVHRLLGRVIGVAYLLPFLWFIWRGKLGAGPQAATVADLRARRAAGRGRLVDGGIRPDQAGGSFARPSRHPSRAGAADLSPAIVWTLRRLARKAPPEATPRLKITARILVGLTFVQLYLGALVAGLRAGLVYNTWPDIDGGFVPPTPHGCFSKRHGGAICSTIR